MTDARARAPSERGVVLEVDVLVEVALERLQLLHRNAVGGAAVGRHRETVATIAGSLHGVSHPSVLVLHHL